MKNLTVSLKELTSYDHTMKEFPWCVKQNKDELSPISNWRFETIEEAALVAMLFLSLPVDKAINVDLNWFKYQIKSTFRILGIKSNWA